MLKIVDKLNRILRYKNSFYYRRDTALHKVQTLKEELEHTKAEVRRLKEDNQCLLDEHIALQVGGINKMEIVNSKWIK